MSQEITMERIGGADVRAMFDEILAVYLEVYAEPPYSSGPLFHADAFTGRTHAQAPQKGFACVTARDPDRALAGFAFGLPFGPGRWWAGRATPPPPQILGAWKFAVIELVLRRPWRGRGIGRRLHDTLLSGRPEQYAILTAAPEAPARQMYARWGWTQIGTAHHTPDSPVLDALVLSLTQPGLPALS